MGREKTMISERLIYPRPRWAPGSGVRATEAARKQANYYSTCRLGWPERRPRRRVLTGSTLD